jgi:hypothetical protein
LDTALVIIFIILLVINIPAYRVYYSMIFRDKDDFSESVRYSFTSDLFSLFRGEYIKDRIGEFKLGIFVFACIFTVIIEFMIIKSIIYRIF